MAVEVLSYTGAFPREISVTAAPGATISIWIRPINSRIGGTKTPYPVEDPDIHFRLRLWQERSGDELLNSDDEADVVVYRHTGTTTAAESADPSQLEFTIPDELAAERFPTGIYRGCIEKTDTGAGSLVRWANVILIIQSDTRQ